MIVTTISMQSSAYCVCLYNSDRPEITKQPQNVTETEKNVRLFHKFVPFFEQSELTVL